MPAPRNELDSNQVVLNLLSLSRALQELSDELDGLEQRAVEAKETYTLAYAKAFLSNSGAVEVRKQQTLLDTGTNIWYRTSSST